MTEPGYDELLRPRKLKWALVLLLSVAFVTIGLLILRDPGAAGDRPMAYACVVFFGLGTLASLTQLLPGSSFLRLTPQGLTVRTLWRTTFYRWADIKHFGVAEFTTSHGGFRQRHRLIGFDFAHTHSHGSGTQALSSLNRQLTGFQAALPDNYGRGHAELAAYLNTLKARYAEA